MAEQSFNWQGTIRRRVIVTGCVFAVWTLGIEARLFYLQVVSHEHLVAIAAKQQVDTLALPAKRGEITDRYGRMLAYSVDVDTVYAVPREIAAADAARAAAALCGALDNCSKREEAVLAARLDADRPFTYVRRRVTPSEAHRVSQLKLKGVGFRKESRRFYPNKELAAHALGYVGLDNVGLSGLEASYDQLIRGKEGTLIAHIDARQQTFAGRVERAPTAGGSLELTLDEHLQHIVERELRAGVESTRADGGSAILMDPESGEILALANWPTFNPNAYNVAREIALRNRAVQDIYEPGSTFKVVTMAAALEEDVMGLNALVDTNPGTIRFAGRVIDEYGGRNLGVLSLTDLIVKSSNVGAVKVGLRIGAERLGVYALRFGFGKPTSPDFPAESPGILWPASRLNESGLASMAMGYQVGVTPLQMTAAMNAVANGGTWIEPRIVRAVTRDGARTAITPRTKRRVISEATALEMLPVLEKVVTDGTAKRAQILGYPVAGKTGTADKLVNGRYVGSMQNVSFLGFVPSRSPALTAIVMIDTPRVSNDTGGGVAAPIFQRIGEAALRYLGVAPTESVVVPLLAERQAPQTLVPATVTNTSLPPAVMLAEATDDPSLLPDLRGMSARDALRRLARAGLSARIEGTGLVVEQSPAPGTPLEPGTVCRLVLDRNNMNRVSAVSVEQR